VLPPSILHCATPSIKIWGSGPPAAGWSPATLAFAAAMAGPEESEQAIEVEESVPEALRETRAEEGVVRYWSLRGPGGRGGWWRPWWLWFGGEGDERFREPFRKM
jgi:hypothetical protein